MEESFGLLFKKINDRLYQRANNELAKNDLTLTQMRVLHYLFRQENQTASMKEMERKFEVAQATMAGIISRLEAKQFVEGYQDPKDRRVKMVRLSGKGESFLGEHHHAMELRDEELVTGFSDEQKEELYGYLQKVYANLCSEMNDRKETSDD